MGFLQEESDGREMNNRKPWLIAAAFMVSLGGAVTVGWAAGDLATQKEVPAVEQFGVAPRVEERKGLRPATEAPKYQPRKPKPEKVTRPPRKVKANPDDPTNAISEPREPVREEPKPGKTKKPSPRPQPSGGNHNPGSGGNGGVTPPNPSDTAPAPEPSETTQD